MKYFKNPITGEVFAYDMDDPSQVEAILPGLVAMTDEEVQLHLNPPPTPEQILAEAQAQFKVYNDHANAQKLGLTNRISTLQDSVDLDLATPDDVAELVTKQAALLVWKKYSILLGRIPTAIGWPAAPTWPPQPVDAISDTMLSITSANRSTVINLANQQNVLLE
ncbi:MAG: tail fiber assembly protein [Pseudomonas sp.]